MKRTIIFFIKGYQYIFSPDSGMLVRMGLKKAHTCMFYPTCSQYTIEAVEKYGVVSGCARAARRILRCNPHQKPRIDKP